MIDWKKYIGATILVAGTSTLAASEPPAFTGEGSCCSSASDTSTDSNCDGSCLTDTSTSRTESDNSAACETSDCGQTLISDTNGVSAADLEAADVTIIKDSLNPVIDQFNQDLGKRRVVALLSPTCGGCVYAAKALEKEIIQAYPDEDLSIIIIWEPMLGSDNEDAARKSSYFFDDPRVHQFYDVNRLSGAAYSRDLFPTVTEDMLGSLSNDHFLRKYIEKGLDKQPQNKPLWDVVYFYGEDIEWNETPPESESWSKQIMFQSGAIEKKPSLFWVDSYKSPVKNSDWYLEVRNKMKDLLKDESASSPEIPAETKASLISLSDTEQPVIDWFRARNGKLRFIALLSPS